MKIALNELGQEDNQNDNRDDMDDYIKKEHANENIEEILDLMNNEGEIN